MAKQAATTKQTGGGGYSFEDKVAARFMAMMLAGRPPLDERTGVIVQINSQNRTDGWLIDDLLLTLNGKDGESRFALSVKSNQQITPKGFPADFVTAIWEQWHHTVSDVFDAKRDHLGLVVSQLPSDIRSGWHGLLEKAVNTDPAAVVTRLETPKSANEIERQLFQSLACNLSGKSATKEEQVLILKRTRVFDLDFEETPSRDEREAVSICQVCLSTGSRDEANILWIFLLQTAREFSATGGSLSLETLLGKLRPMFGLKAYPEFDADFGKLADFTTMLIDAIPDRIANLASIDRKEEVELLITQLNERRSVALTGPSGTGKSVVSKRVAQSLQGNGTVVWLDAQVLDASTINEVENKIGLRHPLRTLVNHVAAHSALLVLDGLDAFSSNAIQNAAHLVRTLGLGDAGTTWKLLVTCQTEEWERVALSLLRQGAPTNLFKSTNIAFPSDEQLRSVWTDIPSLTALARRIELRPLLRNLKLLDIVASNASIVGKINASSSVGESDMIRWFWDDVVSDETSGLARSRLLLRLSEHEADQLRTTMAITDLDDSEAKTLKGLVDARIFRSRDEQISFEHDLYGDWFRQRKLVSQKAFLKSFMVSRIANPRWLRALRLFGLDLLEQSRGDVTAWRNAMKSLRPSPGSYDLANDVLLESVIFASNPQPLLEAMWDDLMSDGAELLRRLLRRFLHVATLPNPRYFASSGESEGNTSTFSATVDRLPYWPYWLPLLAFLSSRAESVAESVPIEAALMANTWLRRGGRNWPHRNVAAAIALRVAEKYVGADSDHYGERGEASEAIYNALLAASYDMPDEAIPLILKLCQRTEAASNEPIDETLDEGDEELIPLPWSSGSRRLAPPWPDGPRRRVNERFQEVALLPEALVPLIESRPAIAREVLLALVIEDPKPSDFPHWEMMSRRFGTEHLQALYPPIYFRGPFRHFLSLQPKDGLETIIRLVNFATERWADQFTKGGQPVPKIKVRHQEGERVLLGDLDVFFWFRDRLIDSHSVPSALMALEFWLYEKLENNEPIDEWVTFIFDQSTTVALAAVLCFVGKKHPALFAGSLRPLLGVWQFYWWDLRSTATREDETLVGISLMSWSGYGEKVFNAVRDWHALPHRKQALPEVAFNLLLTNAQVQETFKEIRKQWEAELIELREQNPVGDFRYLEKVIAEFNPNNYQFKEHPRGILIEFVASEEMRRKAEPELERSHRQMLFMSFPHRCRELLDKGERLNADQLEDFWNQLVQFPDLFESNSTQVSATRIEDVVCGGIAVLLCLHSEWLEVHAERSAWCDEWLVRIITTPPTSDPMLFEGTLFDRSWDSFLANIAASAWRANPDDSEARTLVADIAMTLRYETVSILMRSVVQHRNELGTEFERLLSLLLLWAGIRNIWNYSRRFNIAWGGVDRWRNRLMAAFVERRIPTQIASWARIAAASNRRVAWMQYRRTEGMDPTDRPGRNELVARMARKPGLDLGLLKSSFAAIPSLPEATSDEERSSWIRLWKEALGVTLRFASAGEEDEWGGDHHPSDYDSWAFERIAELIIHLKPEEDPPSFWSPILDLGPDCHRWVENFLRSWFTHGYAATASVAHFASTWKAMIEHAMTSSAWKDTSEWKGNRNLNSMWGHLFDNVWGSRLVKSEEFRGVISDMVPLYRDWATHWLDQSDNIDTFAGFLCHPSAADLLPEGMKWIVEIAKQYSDHDWSQRPNNASAFIRLIEHWWNSRQGSSIPVAEVETAMGLLKLLSDRQIPRALELQDRIAKRH